MKASWHVRQLVRSVAVGAAVPRRGDGAVGPVSGTVPPWPVLFMPLPPQAIQLERLAEAPMPKAMRKLGTPEAGSAALIRLYRTSAWWAARERIGGRPPAVPKGDVAVHVSSPSVTMMAKVRCRSVRVGLRGHGGHVVGEGGRREAARCRCWPALAKKFPEKICLRLTRTFAIGVKPAARRPPTVGCVATAPAAVSV